MEAFLREVLPRIIPEDCTFSIHPFQGKHQLLRNLESRLHAYGNWLPDDSRILVLIDRDNDDCEILKQKLEVTLSKANLVSRSKSGTDDWQIATRIVVEELEAWYFGDWNAVQTAYSRVDQRVPDRARYRKTDEIRGGTWEAFEREMKRSGYFTTGLRKVEAARAIGQHINPDHNRSHSFTMFRDAIVEATAP